MSVHAVYTRRRLCGLQLGFHGATCDFDHKPYAERSADARAAYDRLTTSMHAEGLRHPIIVHGPHVLAGMRRVETARQLGWDGDRWIPAWDVIEDVATWTGEDVDRFVAWKALLYPDLAEFQG